MDGKADGAWSGLEQRIELQRAPLKLIDSSKLVRSALSRAMANAMANTHLERPSMALAHTTCVFFICCFRSMSNDVSGVH